MDLQTRIAAKQAVTGLGGLILSAALFVYSAIYMYSEGIYYSLAGLGVMCGLFSIGYAFTGSIITSSVIPFIMFIASLLTGLIPQLPDSSPIKPFLQFLESIGLFIFLLSIVAAVLTHQHVNRRKYSATKIRDSVK